MAALNSATAYALARALAGMEAVPQVGVGPLAGLLVENWRGKTPGTEDLDRLREWFGPEIVGQIYAVDPKGPAPAPLNMVGAVVVPPLPSAAVVEVEPEQQVGKWLDWFVTWAKRRATMTDSLFLETGGLWLLGLAVARRAVVKLDFGLIYSPLYVLWTAGTTYWRKSTGLRVIEQLAGKAFPELLLASQSTPEMLLYRLAGGDAANYESLSVDQKALEDAGKRHAGQRGFITDEMTQLFQKKYMEGLPELFMQMYDCPPTVTHEFKTQGKLVVTAPGLSLLFATTPSRLATVWDDGAWDMGLLPRFILATPESRTVRWVDAKRYGDHHDPPPQVLDGLKALYAAFKVPVGQSIYTEMFEQSQTPTFDDYMTGVGVSDEALAGFNAYAKALHGFTGPEGGLDNRLAGVYGRLHIQGLKAALNLALVDWAMAGAKGSPRIEKGHWARGQALAEKWRASAHRLLGDLNQRAEHKYEDRIMEYLKAPHKKAPTKYQISRGTKVVGRALTAALDTLEEDEQIARMVSGKRTGYVLGGG